MTEADFEDGNAQYSTDYDATDRASERDPDKCRKVTRRCSVTKFSLEDAAGKNSGSAEAAMMQNLHAAEMLQRFRNGEVEHPQAIAKA